MNPLARFSSVFLCLALAAGTARIPLFVAFAAGDDKASAGAVEPAMLLIGDAAPSLAIEKWVKGSPVVAFEAGKVYVVEFWATWCGPCKVSIPHLTELQQKYKAKGVTMIGVSGEENGLDAIEPFVEQQGSRMDYTVAFDKDRGTNRAYMDAARQEGIPTAFVVNGKGKVAWIGHPSQLDEPLSQVVAGTFDIEQSKREQAAEIEQAKIAKAKAKRLKPFNDDLKKFAAEKNWDAMGTKVEELAAMSPEDAYLPARYVFNKQMSEKEFDKAYAFAGRLVDGSMKNNPMFLNEVAWTIVDPQSSPAKQDLDLALRAAKQADDVSQHNDAMILDTLANVYFARGDKAKAISTQERALTLLPAKAEDADMQEQLDSNRKDLEASLSKFKQ